MYNSRFSLNNVKRGTEPIVKRFDFFWWRHYGAVEPDFIQLPVLRDG